MKRVNAECKPGGRRGHAIGWIRFMDGRPLRWIHLSVERAREMLSGAPGTDRARARFAVTRHPPTALGRALAHEIGHYLLRSLSYSGRG